MKKTLSILLGCILIFIISVSIDKFIEKEESEPIDFEMILHEKTNDLSTTNKIDIKLHDEDNILKTITDKNEINELITILSRGYFLTSMLAYPSEVSSLYYLEFYDNDNKVIDIIEITTFNYVKHYDDTDDAHVNKTIRFTFRSFLTNYSLNKDDGESIIKLIEE